MKTRILNRSVSFLKKNGVYVFYNNFNFILLKGTAAKLMYAILGKDDESGQLSFDNVPEDFVLYLISKKIIIEEETT